MQENLYLIRSLLLHARNAMSAAGAPEVDRALDLIEDCIEASEPIGDDEYADIFRAFETGIEPGPWTVDEILAREA